MVFEYHYLRKNGRLIYHGPDIVEAMGNIPDDSTNGAVYTRSSFYATGDLVKQKFWRGNTVDYDMEGPRKGETEGAALLEDFLEFSNLVGLKLKVEKLPE